MDYTDQDNEKDDTFDANLLDTQGTPDHEDNDKHVLLKYATADNLTTELLPLELQAIASQLLSGVREDKSSQSKWMQDTDEALKLSRLTKEPKNTPLPQSSNVKYPLITIACYQFAAREYPELSHDNKIVKAEIFGKSNPMLDLIADGITTHMSFQLLASNSNWLQGMDKLLIALPNIGFICKKTYYDTDTKKNCSHTCYYKDLILRNDPAISCIDDLERITHVIHCYPNDLITGSRSGLYDEEAVEAILQHYPATQINPVCDLHEIHCFLDLDQDGYREPYIVTMHESTNQIIRIKARFDKEGVKFNSKKEVVSIKAVQYFTDYHFLPAPDGSYMSIGFGILMLPLSESVNTILNELIDAGNLANLQTGIMDSRLKFMGGSMEVEPGSWAKVKGVIGQTIKDGFYPLNYKEPSSVLFQLLGLLLQAAKDLTSSTDALQGAQNATNVPATSMLAMIEQGLKLHSSIHSRVLRAMGEEFKKLFYLNGKYLDEAEYHQLLGDEFKGLPNIYKNKTVQVMPVADPNVSSDAQRLTQAQVVMGMSQAPGSLINQYQAQKMMLTAARVNNVDALLPKAAANQPKAPDPKMIDAQNKHQSKMAEVQIKGKAQDLKEKEFIAKLPKTDAEITEKQANAVKLMADAKATQKNADVNDHNSKVETVKAQVGMAAQAHQQMTDANAQAQELKIKQQQVDNQHQQATTGLEQSQDQIDNDQQQPEPGPAGPSDEGNGQ